MKATMKKILLVLALVALGTLANNAKADAAKKTYTINANTKPCNTSYTKAATYNKKSKQYYTLRSYLEKIEKNGGGTLVLKKGKYKICSTLYIPSNTTIKLKTGATIYKTNVTGNKKLKASKYLFQLVPTSKSKKKKTVTALKASRNVSILGYGTAKINMGKISGAYAFAMAHNYKVNIKNIRFYGRNGGNYIAISGCRNVIIEKCRFYAGVAATSGFNAYDIRMEVANKTIDNFGFTWSKMDNTTNMYIIIRNNNFLGAVGGIGTIKYAIPTIKKVDTVLYQTNISITGNNFRDMSSTAIQGVAWKSPTITGNKFYRVDKSVMTPNGVVMKGTVTPNISANTFNYIATPISIEYAKNGGSGKNFATLYNTTSTASTSKMRSNTVTNASIYYIPYKDKSTSRLAYFYNPGDNNLTITKDAGTYQGRYTDASSYKDSTKDYYQFRSYFDQLEECGGGTLTVQTGIYNLSNTLYVPSNITVIFADGVTIQKSAASYDLTGKNTMFTFAPPSAFNTSGTIGGYNGTHDVTFKSASGDPSKVIISCQFNKGTMAVSMGHTKNVTFQGIGFAKYYGLHLIECNSSYNALIENCTFTEFTASTTDLTSVGAEKTYKESINIDGDNSYGFSAAWSKHDATTCDTVVIRNNKFSSIGTAVGSHTYSATGTTQNYHKNIQIYNNDINTTLNAGIRAVNWKDTVIRENTFKEIGFSASTGKYGDYLYGVYLRGVVNPTVTANTFDTVKYPIYVVKTQTSLPEAQNYEPTVCIISAQNWADMLNNTAIDCTSDTVKLDGFDVTELPVDYAKAEYSHIEHNNR